MLVQVFNQLRVLMPDFKNNVTNLLAFIGLIALVVAYSSGIVTTEALSSFSRNYADTFFLAPILITIARKLRNPTSIVDPIYWLLLGTAFFTWFVLTIVRITLWDDLTAPSKELITNVSYFLYFSLTIAAIEVKSYNTAGQLLTQQSMLIWVSTLSFTLGAFVLLALTPTQVISSTENYFDSSFLFYVVMDIYLMARWWYLAWSCRKDLWIGYSLFGLAAFFWTISDIIQGLAIADFINAGSGSVYDWFWYLSYILIYIALQFNVTTSNEQNSRTYFSRSHLFNSPLFFLIVCFVLLQLFQNSNHLLIPLNSTQNSVFNLWFSVLLCLSVLQLIMLIHRERITSSQLAKSRKSTEVIQQRMQQQAIKLESQSASNKAILDTTHNAIFTLDLKGEILSCNPAACSLLGFSENELVGAAFIKKVKADGELARFFSYQSYRQKLASQTGGIEVQSSVTKANNTKIAVHATLSQEKNNNEGLLVVSLVNISEQKQAEHEAHQLKDQFTANISHEFRTPLTIINGVLDNLLDQDKYQGDQEQLKTAKRNGLRMVRMVEQLLELSRIANDPIPLSSLDAHPIASFVCQSFEEIARNNRIAFHYHLQEACWVIGNQQAYEKILFNLLSNAFKYTEEGSVEVFLKTNNGMIELRVADTGIGIDETQQTMIFDRFHRVETNTTQTIHGVGIGLALVKELCEAMQWQLKMESTPGKGSQFSLLMPLSERTAATLEEKISVQSGIGNTVNSLSKSIESEVFDAQTKAPRNPSKKSKYSVLIVEDNLDMQSHISEILSPFHHCLLADNGEEGVRLAMDYIPDIIISDVMMPGISGFELLKTLKKTEITTHIPIILLTARSDSASKIRGLEAQADDYLSKPFDAKELLLRVKNQLNSREKLQLKLNTRLQQGQEDPLSDPVLEDKFIQKLQTIFEEHYREASFSMLDLANLLAMSDRQAQRKIKSLLGISPLEALKQFRLKKAKKLLETGDQIGVVAQTCGFSSQSYFGRCFKEEYKMTPKAFQQSLK